MKSWTKQGGLVALSLLAGCVSVAPEPSGVEQGPTNLGVGGPEFEMGWGLTECQFVVAYLPVREEMLAPYLPAGFQSRPFQSGPGAALGARLGVEAFRCREGRGLNDSVSPLDYGSVFASVTPPINRTRDGVQSYYVKWDVLVPDPARRTVLADHGVAARDGSVIHSVVGPSEGPRRVLSSLRLTGLGEFTFDGAVGRDNRALSFSFIEYGATPSGLVAWSGTANGESIDAGYGTVEVPPNTWVRRVVEQDRAPATFAIGTYTFTNATIRFVGP